MAGAGTGEAKMQKMSQPADADFWCKWWSKIVPARSRYQRDLIILYGLYRICKSVSRGSAFGQG